MLNSTERKFLKGLAHKLQPMVLVGKGGISDGVREEIATVLESHELIKVKFNDFKAEREALSSEVVDKLGAELVQIIGNVAVIYRASSRTENRRIRLPRKKEVEG